MLPGDGTGGLDHGGQSLAGSASSLTVQPLGC